MANEVTLSVTADNTLKSSVITGVTWEALWKESVNKVYHPDQYLPATDVVTRDNPDGSVWRSMKIIPTGKVFVETITVHEQEGVIRFHVLDGDGNKTNHVHINSVQKEGEGSTIEYYILDTETNEKKPLMGNAAILKIVQNAKAASN